MRKGLKTASEECGVKASCVLTSEIKPYAVSVLRQNHPGEKAEDGISKIDAHDIPDFDILCAGFPCQAFSAAGKRKGFADPRLPKGCNIVTGKLSFGINKILDPGSVAPALVATDMQRLAVADGEGLRSLTLKEGLRLFGYPEDFRFDIAENDGFDLMGNTVVVPVVKAISLRLLKALPL